MTKRKKRLLAFLAVLLFIFILLFVAVQQNPRLKILISTLRFSRETLNNPSYIAYQVDLMELCRDYLNGDTVLSGSAVLNDVKKVKNTMDMKISGERSFAQKKAICQADLSVLILHMGEFDFYAADKDLYMIVPMLDNLSYGFDTGIELFWKAPELTSDLNAAWFQENWDNIVTFTEQIGVVANGKTIQDDHRTSTGYQITIPEGCGMFIWEFLGMEAPDHDVVFDLYLTPGCQVRRVEVDLTETLKDSSFETANLTIDGIDCSTAILTVTLPDDEKATVTAVRNGEIISINTLRLDAVYDTFNGDQYHMTSRLTWESDETGTDLEVHDLQVLRNEDLLASGYFKGNVSITTITEDVFRDAPDILYSIDKIPWKDLRGDVEGFFDSVTKEIIKRMTP